MASSLNHLFELSGYIGKGVLITLQYSVLSTFGGLIIGLALALMGLSQRAYLKWIVQGYVSVFRGTPALLQLSIIYFGVPSLTSYQISPLFAGVIAFSLNSGAYVTEIIRSGLNSIDRGQFEAAHALGLTRIMTLRDIILPQVMRNTLPSLVNESVNVLKETALISTVGEGDIMRKAQLVAAETYTYFEPLMVAAVFYYMIVLILTRLAHQLEVKLNYAHH